MCRRDTQREMGNQYHVYSDGGRLALSGRGFGCILPISHSVVDATPPRPRTGHAGRPNGGGATRNLRSRHSLYSDRGTQYTTDAFQEFLGKHEIVSSMSEVGHCYNNAVAESFLCLLKRERVNQRQYQTHAETRTDIFD